MTAHRLTPELRRELAAIAARAECELIHLEFKGGRLRLILDRPEGVTLHDCEIVSRQASALLDVADYGVGQYTLEVSSPGLDRELYSKEDYVRFTGSRVRVTWQSPEMQRKKSIVGTLAGLESDEATGHATVKLIEDEASEPLTLDYGTIKVARLVLDP